MSLLFYGDPVIRRTSAVAVLVAATCAILISSCGAEPQILEPSPARHSTVAEFKSNAAALAEAKKVYESFIRTSAEVSQDGGAHTSKLQPYLTRDAYLAEQKSIAAVAARGLATEGKPKLLKFKSQSVSFSSGVVSAYACVDFSDVRVKDSSGKDVTPADRPGKQTSNPTFIMQDSQLVLAEDKSWSGASIC